MGLAKLFLASGTNSLLKGGASTKDIIKIIDDKNPISLKLADFISDNPESLAKIYEKNYRNAWSNAKGPELSPDISKSLREELEALNKVFIKDKGMSYQDYLNKQMDINFNKMFAN